MGPVTWVKGSVTWAPSGATLLAMAEQDERRLRAEAVLQALETSEVRERVNEDERLEDDVLRLRSAYDRRSAQPDGPVAD